MYTGRRRTVVYIVLLLNDEHVRVGMAKASIVQPGVDISYTISQIKVLDF